MPAHKKPQEIIDKVREAILTTQTGAEANQKLAQQGICVGTKYVYKEAQRMGRPYGVEAKPLVLNKVDINDPLTRSLLIRLLRQGKQLPSVLARKLRCDEELIHSMVGVLRAAGYNVQFTNGCYLISATSAPSEGYNFVDNSPLISPVWTIGVVSDTHLCSKYQRLDVLESAYDAFKEAKVERVFHCGNIVDGHAPFNRFEIICHGITDQANYVLDHYPQRSGITTYFISSSSCHEGWWCQREGIDFGKYLLYEAQAVGRKDFVWLGRDEADVEFKNKAGAGNFVKIMHPGGGSAYAVSYAPQKIVEALQGGEKPGMLLLGHYHKASFNLIRNVAVIQAGATQDQTPWMRKHKIDAHLGYWVVSFQQDLQGAIRSVTPRFTAFYDRGYHSKLVVRP